MKWVDDASWTEGRCECGHVHLHASCENEPSLPLRCVRVLPAPALRLGVTRLRNQYPRVNCVPEHVSASRDPSTG